jgi:hypothetical protein
MAQPIHKSNSPWNVPFPYHRRYLFRLHLWKRRKRAANSMLLRLHLLNSLGMHPLLLNPLLLGTLLWSLNLL